MQEAPQMQAQATTDDSHHEHWGDGSVVYHRGKGQWIMYDPDEDTLDLDNWR